MNRTGKLITATVSLTLSGLAWLISPLPTQATTVEDSFPMSATAKEWCQGNPKFFENITVRINPKNPSQNTILTIEQDPQNTGDLTKIEATINTQGGVPDIDAMTLNGLAFPTNKSGSTAQIILFGINPLNNAHFFSIRGKANLDKTGHVTKVTGTFMYQITGTYTIDKFGNQSGPVDCFGSGTLVTGKKLL